MEAMVNLDKQHDCLEGLGKHMCMDTLWAYDP